MFHTLDSFDTEFSADSVEWCPVECFKDIFVCGTYQLTKAEESTSNKASLSERLGRIYMLRVVEGHLLLLQKLETPAVLDMKWSHIVFHKKILLGVVNSLGYLQIYELFKNENKECLKLIMERKVLDGAEEVLALSLDWCSGRWTGDIELNPKIVVSDSRGSISLFELHEKKLEKIISWHAHEFEAWIAAFDYWNTNIMYTGGDDCHMKSFDVRAGSDPITTNRIHGAGVTSIHSNASKEFLICSGSYDEILRLWDTRYFKRPMSEANLGGGIWRLKWDPFAREYLLAACMYGGFRIIDCSNANDLSVIGEYNEHESISYGCDWSFLNNDEVFKLIGNCESQSSVLIGTCSFYDHALKLSIVRLKDD